MELNVATEFSPFPGPRSRNEGEHSAEQFRDELLAPRFNEAVSTGTVLQVDLDGGFGYATSFLEEAFGGLAREHGIEQVLDVLVFKSDDEPYLIDDIHRYIRGATTVALGS